MCSLVLRNDKLGGIKTLFIVQLVLRNDKLGGTKTRLILFKSYEIEIEIYKSFVHFHAIKNLHIWTSN